MTSCYRKIVAVVSEHTTSTVSAHYAISLAEACKAELLLYAVHAEGSSEALIRQTDRHMAQLFTLAFERDIPVTRISEIGQLSRLLPRRVQAEQADLVWYPLAPHEQYGDRLQNHTVHRLLRSIKTDLAIMRTIALARPHPRHILVPLRHVSNDRGHRLRFLSELAHSFHAQITLFHLYADRSPKQLPDAIRRFRTQLQQQQITVLERSGKGTIAKAIMVEAVSHHHDLIVLGASERGLLRRLLFGNPAGDVMHQPPCNTILFRAATEPP